MANKSELWKEIKGLIIYIGELMKSIFGLFIVVSAFYFVWMFFKDYDTQYFIAAIVAMIYSEITLERKENG